MPLPANLPLVLHSKIKINKLVIYDVLVDLKIINDLFFWHELFIFLARLKVAQDVPKYTMVTGERAELRGLNLEGLHRHGFTITEVGRSLLPSFCFKFLQQYSELWCFLFFLFYSFFQIFFIRREVL